MFNNLINQDKGLWKDKKMRFVDGAWGEVKVKKSDIIDFINKVDTEIGEESALNMDKVKQLDDKKYYALICCES